MFCLGSEIKIIKKKHRTQKNGNVNVIIKSKGDGNRRLLIDKHHRNNHFLSVIKGKVMETQTTNFSSHEELRKEIDKHLV